MSTMIATLPSRGQAVGCEQPRLADVVVVRSDALICVKIWWFRRIVPTVRLTWQPAPNDLCVARGFGEEDRRPVSVRFMFLASGLSPFGHALYCLNPEALRAQDATERVGSSCPPRESNFQGLARWSRTDRRRYKCLRNRRLTRP